MTSLAPRSNLGALIARLLDVRRLTEVLAEPLSAEDQTVQSMPDTSPTKWHRAHTTWFFETFVLGLHLPDYGVFDDDYNYLFNSYYEAVGERYPRPNRGMVTRPGVAEIAAYRSHVDAALGELIDLDSTAATTVAPLIELGIQHEQQHQELILMDIKHALANNTVSAAYHERRFDEPRDPGPLRWHRFDGGLTEIGVEKTSNRFHFDNEQPRHQVLVAPFELGNRLITCGEWLEFMADGGYEQPTLWLSDGWHHSNSQGWRAPLYWSEDNDGVPMLHTMGGTRPVALHEPVCHLSFYEADAFATWAGVRLPTEFEWELAATTDRGRPGELLDQPAGNLGSFAEQYSLHPSGPHASGPESGDSMSQLVGDCWEWTGSPYRPYPGYRAPDGAIGEYNGKFMINTMVLRGGSAFTPCDHVRDTYRNFFHPHTRWHLSGLRLARD